MSSGLYIESNLTENEKYKVILEQLSYILLKEDNPLSSLANLTALLKQTFDKISWVGFYLYDSKRLYLGPFQGKLACTNIELGKGVCGKSAANKISIIVPNVNEFPGHIACDPESKSEIVIPVLIGEELFGVLDIDSSSLNSFTETDKKYLESVCKYLSDKILKK
ncbi:MAG: GAF domain-containing protein [Bacteroidota bacterium]|nr:GAF domain-containing protein [Bacteroidota bacterium]